MLDFKKINKFIQKVEESEKQVFPFKDELLKVGLDLGTAYIVLVVLDQNNQPIVCEKKAARVLRDGVVIDYFGAQQIVKSLKDKIEKRLKVTLTHCSIAMPAGTDSSVKTHVHIAEAAGVEVTAILDEPSAANAIYEAKDGAIVDIGGGTTGIAIIKQNKVIYTADEPTGGNHLSLVLAGRLGISIDEAEQMKMNNKKHKEIFPIVKPVLEKMAFITNQHIRKEEVNTVYLCGGTCCIAGIETVFEKQLNLPIVKPINPFLVTPAGIATFCNKTGLF